MKDVEPCPLASVPKRDCPCAFIPYSAQYLRNKRNDVVRYVIFTALGIGSFTKDALRVLVNEYIARELGGEQEISTSGFGVMLSRNCEGIWELNGEIVSKLQGWHYLEQPENERRRTLDQISLCLGKLVTTRAVMRNKGSGVFLYVKQQ